MIAAVVALAIAAVGALVTIAVLVRALLTGLRSERASFAAEVLAGKAQVAAELAQRHAERARDLANATAEESIKERDAANGQLVATQEALTKALQENAHAAVVKIRSARDVDAAMGELDRLFAVVPKGASPPVPIVPGGDDLDKP